MEVKKIELKTQQDPRGWSVDLFKFSALQLDLKYIYLVTSKPGTVRGNHYHEHKNEWFCLVKGRARFTLVDNRTGEKEVFEMSDNPITLLNIPTQVTHAIENVSGEDIYILELADHEFDPQNPDTFKKQIV
ncbi:MAG: WxcM-like domain-containing protein [Candidatus Micrarchaeota archaeon]|nr:WxcM-like domain-containing protein [Candidatus Micrarchaeota archaeon]